MNTSLAESDEVAENVKSMATTLLRARVKSLERIAGGLNGRVYRLGVEPSRTYAVKVYFRDTTDDRARMETELSGLAFMRQNGIACVPVFVSASREHHCAIFEWIDGRRIRPQNVDAPSIDKASSFLIRLFGLRDRPGSETLEAASEACFSGPALLKNLQDRLRPLMDRADRTDLKAYLTDEFCPALDQVTAWSRHRLGRHFDRELEQKEKTLSPSDFGFHNALMRSTGEIIFLDFEYFGWDDPVKMISDFLLHPAMVLPPAFLRRFAGSVVRDLAVIPGLADRLEAFYPLFGLKWCLIFLNEFLPEHLLRRRFAGLNDSDHRERLSEQLAKAKMMLQRILSEYEHLPYI